MISKSEADKTNDFLNIFGKFEKLSKLKKKISPLGINKPKANEKDKKIDSLINMLLLEYNIPYNKIINIPITHKFPFNGTLFSYAIQKNNKTDNDNYYLIYYLKFYDAFNNLLIKLYNDEEKTFLFSQIISKINIEEKEQNDILFKVGENSEKFYFLLNGSATRLITHKYEELMDKHEYYIYMKYIYKLDEIELFNLILSENEESFDKFELLRFILGDKNLKFHAEAIKQLKNMESSYISQRLFANKLNDKNFNAETVIILSQDKKKLDDIIKGDYIISCLDEHIRKLNVPIENYINNLKPIHFEEENEDLVKKKLNLYTYKIDKEIKVGEHLEELNESKISKKVSTIVCNSHCIFGYFLKKEYIGCLKATQTKYHRNDINFLLGNELFSSLNFHEFDRNYYRLFELIRKPQKQMLFVQGEKNDEIFFLKQGEVSVFLEGNVNDLYRIIGLKGGPKNRKLLDVNYIKRFYSIDIDDKFFTESKNFSLFKINENFPIGLEDFLDEEDENKHLFNVYCNMDSEVLSIKKEHLEEITYREREVYRVKEKYIVKRKKLLIDKLNSLKNGLIQKYIYEKYKVKLNLPNLFDEAPLSPKKNRNIERNFHPSPNRKNELLYIDTKVNGKSYREITSALKLKEIKDLEEKSIEQNKNKNDNRNEKNENENNNNNTGMPYDSIKTDINIDITNGNNNFTRNSISGTKPKRRAGTIRNANSKEKKVKKELLELIKSPAPYQIIRLQKNKKLALDPLDRIYKDLKYPTASNSKSNKTNPENKINFWYEIKSFKVLSPLKQQKFIPNNRKIVLRENSNSGYFNQKMKEIKVFKTISQDKSSVILKAQISPHDKYYDRNNTLISTINFNDNKKEIVKKRDKRRLIFNNIKINESLFKMDKLMDKKARGTNTEENKKINEERKSLVFPNIINSSINRNIY